MSKIGDVLPADDEVARWVLVMCLASNDVGLTLDRVEQGFDEGTALHWSRVLAGHLYEVAHFLRRENCRAPIQRFVKTLKPAHAKGYRELLQPEFLKGVLEADRNRVFHYPSADTEAEDKGGQVLRDALDEVRDLEAALRVHYDGEGRPDGFRFAFAEEVAVRFAVADLGTTEEKQLAAILEVKRTAERLMGVASTVFDYYAKTERGGLELGEPEPLSEGTTGAQTGAPDEDSA
jgi:hypothetical protein